MLRRLRRRLADESGITLVELMVVILLSSFVLTGVMNLMNASSRAGARVSDRSETTQRIRGGIERISRVLRTQVCPTGTIPPVISGSSTSVTFYADRNTTSDFRPRKVTIALSGTRVTQQTWVPTSTAPPWTYNSSPVRTELAEGVAAIPGTPFLTYYGTAAPADTALATPLDEVTVPRPRHATSKVVRIRVGLRAEATAKRPSGTERSDQTLTVTARNLDLSTGQGVQCGG